jgi:cytochrome P450
MAKLEEELRAFFKDENDMDLLSTARLPYLSAVTQESLRLFPPGPNALPRITPPGRTIILGQQLPGNVSSARKCFY